MRTKHLAGLVMATLGMLAQGCGVPATPPLGRDVLTRLASTPDVTVVRYPTPPFRRVHPQTGAAWSAIPLLGLIAGPAAATASAQRGLEVGEQIRVQSGLEDPISRVSGRVVAALAEQAGTDSFQEARPRFLSTDDLAELAQTLGPGLAVDFATVSWGMLAIPKWVPGTTHHYQVAYGARVRLVQLEDRKILWQATCASVGPDANAHWTQDELTDNGGTLLRERLAASADACGGDLVAKLRGERGGARRP